MHRLAHMTVSRQFADLSLREEPSELRSDYAIFAKTKARKPVAHMGIQPMERSRYLASGFLHRCIWDQFYFNVSKRLARLGLF